ncbi:MAG: OmpA family protein [Wenzhouxiangellaceae bacterium]
MIKNRLAVVAGASLLVTQVAIAQSDDVFDDRWYATVFGGWSSLDGDRGNIDDAAVFGLGIGRFLTPNFSVDLEFDHISTDISALPAGFDDDFDLNSLGVIGRYHFLTQESMARPYLLAGIGATDHSGDFSGSTDLYLTAGAGIRFEFTDHLSARLQAAYRYDSDDSRLVRRDGFDDVLVTAGLSYAFGDKPRAAPPPKPQPPPPAPAPRPEPTPQPVDGDDDRDGVRNSRDRCPNTRAGAVVDLDGCEVQEKIDLPGVQFEFDSARLTAKSLAILNEAAALLNHHSKIKVEVGGHTDSVGSDSYNQQLSERRAAAVRQYLIDKGVSADRMTSRGYGEDRPVASNETDAGRAQNRRTELVITSR